MENKYFKPAEFECNCGKCGLGFEQMDQAFLLRLFRARGLSEKPFVLTSAIRCPEHNRNVGGSSNSSHLKGRAVDIAAPDSATRYQVVTSLLGVGFDRLGIGSSFIHVDADPAKTDNVIWVYTKQRSNKNA